MRALSLELGQGEKFISDIIAGKSKRPTPAALRKLSAVIGTDLAALPVQPQVTAADMEQMLRERPPAGWSTSKVSGARSALAWHVRAAGTGHPESTIIDRAKGRAWLSGTTAAAQGMAASTLTTFASHLSDLFDLAGATTRPRQIRDVTGPWRELYDTLAASDAKEYETAVAGTFFAWCDGAGLAIGDVCSESFTDYLAARLASGRVTMSERNHRDRPDRGRDPGRDDARPSRPAGHVGLLRPRRRHRRLDWLAGRHRGARRVIAGKSRHMSGLGRRSGSRPPLPPPSPAGSQ
jgi:hypothetical protein